MKQKHGLGQIDLLRHNRMKVNLTQIIIAIVVLVVLYIFTLPRRKETFRGGEAIGGKGSGSAYQEMGFQDLNEADLIYMKKKEDFRGGGGGGEATGGRTAGPNNSPTLGDSAEFFSEQKEKNKAQIKEAFENIVSGTPETSDVSGPADASLKQPRKPYNLLEQLPPAPRGSISCLKASCCAETDFEWRTNQTGNFLQRTNNYKREFPDNCSGPLHELTLAFYKPELLSKV